MQPAQKILVSTKKKHSLFAGLATRDQLIVYVIGLIILGCGIDLNTKAALGVSPVISVAYNIAVILGAPIGPATFLYYLFLLLLQYVLLAGRLPKLQYLQIGASFLTSLAIQLFDFWLPAAGTVPGRIFELAVAIVLTGIGASITLGMRLVPNPADGLAKVIGDKAGRTAGFGKNLVDAVCVAVASLTGLLFRRSLLGIGIGTVIAAVFTGRVYHAMQPFVEWLYARVTEREKAL